ncbi:MAG TPA: GYF domain-containing protein, partial [Polyangiaceae bacterium]|nr:GYF domain-containing protein [Polyangiaceae bacterium]
MKFLCPNCKAKYRIGPEKMVGRQAAKIRCRKCDYLIQIAYRNEGDEFDVTASPPTAPPAGAGARVAKATAGQVAAPGSVRARSALAEEGSATKKPTAAVPGLPGLGSAKSTRGAALVAEAASTGRRPLAPLPPPPVVASASGAGLAGASAPAASGSPVALGAAPAMANGASGLPLPTPLRAAAANTQLGDQFRESLQAGATEDLPREGWFVGVNGVPLGPIPLGDLRELALAGHIDRRSLVWREGQPEWRPLGKFPGLVRVIDDGASPSITPLAESAPPVPAERTNGSGNGQLATGFDVVRPDLSERPSAWGDLDDDDDDDEQPTTVKGRVSVLPSGNAPAVSLIPSSAPQSLP